ncbi:reverse transcriptase domain-containing protein [Tanacetum coccineum]|uniref:Reverse transcriptase domain-containing protein n=1 Tax=Tanacetum coccineum TaxID=301880 RepID=A0ABQ4YPY7_9ASTR
MPFGLKNAGATYRRLVDKAFDSQVGRNMEVYVDDLVIKGHAEAKMMRDIDETFRTLRRINMKLNPKKCIFGAVEGMFLGYTITPERIKPCPDKTEVCIKKSDFHWTSEAKQAVKQLKQHLAELPLLVAPKPKEELSVCMSASHRAVRPRAELYSHRKAGPIASFCRQKAVESVMLGEHNITYRLRTSVKGQILADFLVEKPDENPPDTSAVETPLESWTLFTDGSSCVDGSGAGLILTIPEGTEFTYTLRFQFTASNNEAEYEALIAGLRIAAQLGVRNVQGIDIAGPFLEGPGEVKFLIVAMDYFTKWIEAKAVATITGNQVKKFVWDNIVCCFSLPGEIVSDNGKQFSDNPFKDWCDKLNITQRFASVKHPQSNGLVERANRSMGEGIKACLGEGNTNWIVELPYVLWAHHTMIKSSHGDTPFSLTYGTEAVIHAEIRMPTYRPTTIDSVHYDEELWLNLDLLEEKQERAAICEAKAKMKMAKYYNARVRGVAFRLGDFVYRSNDASHVAAS